jgi:hypothetical protein
MSASPGPTSAFQVPIPAVDHTLVGVRDLEAARTAYARLGFTLSPRGRHIGWGTANYCAMFEQGYIELLGIVDSAQFTNNLDRFLARREGQMGLAFGTPDAEASARALSARGLSPSEPRDLARELELPEGTVLPRFKLVYLPADEAPALSGFLCQHLTPELLRRPEWLHHANGARRLVQVTTIVADTASLVAPYERLFGLASVTLTDAVLTVWVGRQRLVFATREDFEWMHPGAELPPEPDMPMPVMTTIEVSNLDATAACLDAGDVDFEVAAGGGLLVPAEQACGAILEFVRS